MEVGHGFIRILLNDGTKNYYVAFLRLTTVKAVAIVTVGETTSDKLEQHK